MEMILASNKFEKSVKRSKETWEEYLSSDEEKIKWILRNKCHYPY